MKPFGINRTKIGIFIGAVATTAYSFASPSEFCTAGRAEFEERMITAQIASGAIERESLALPAYQETVAGKFEGETSLEFRERLRRQTLGRFEQHLNPDLMDKKYVSSAVGDVGQILNGTERVYFGQAHINQYFSQSSPFTKFSDSHNEIIGRSVGEVAAGLRSGLYSPDQLPIEVTRINGQLITINNRSLTALTAAGMKPTKIIAKQKDELEKSGPDSWESICNRLEAMPGNKGSDTMLVRGDGTNDAGEYRNAWMWDAPIVARVRAIP